MVSKKWGGGGGCQRNTPLKASLQKVRLPLADSNFKLISKFSLNNSLDGMFWRDHARFLMRVLLALICKSPPQGLDGSFKCQFQTGRSGVELSIMVGFYKDGSRMIFLIIWLDLQHYFLLPHTAMLKQRFTFFFC